MSRTVIQVENLSKRYKLGVLSHQSLRKEIQSAWSRIRGSNDPNACVISQERETSGSVDVLWALRDVSFEVREGEVLGIIGRNGAGKSTLLKILSRVTTPTKGVVRLKGSVASLLEVGTGFHPELTGRENIFLNGAILGMRHEEIARKFDEIVSFAEVEKFIDTPVKRYSSGMYVRLAFSVAAHLEPEILIVDEVLAVGDMQFQRKCLGKMGSVAKSGRTVLFVSHNLDAVQRICSSVLYLREGNVAHRGPTAETIGHYVHEGRHGELGSDLSARTERWGSGRVRITGFAVRAVGGGLVPALEAGGNYDFLIDYAPAAGAAVEGRAAVCVEVLDQRGTTTLMLYSEFMGAEIRLCAGGGRIRCTIRDLNLAGGDYTVTIFLASAGGEVYDCMNDAVRLTVAGGDFFGTGNPGLPEHCRVLTRSFWGVEP